MNDDHKAKLRAGREQAAVQRRDIATQIVRDYMAFLRADAEFRANNGRGLSWARVTVPTDRQFEIARADA